MKFLTPEQLERLPTKRLMSYKNALYKAHERPSINRPNEITKDSWEWQQALLDVKKVLAKRENLPKVASTQRKKRATVIREGDYVRESGGARRWGKVVEVVWGDYGHIGTEVSHYMVELKDGSIVQFEWLGTWKISLLEAMALAAK